MTFDAYGDQATAGTRWSGYDALGRLTADTPTAGGSGYQFSYAGSTGTIASDGASTYTWDPSGSVLTGVGAAGGGSGALALANAHGDVLGQFTASGTAVAGSQAYDPWGKVTASSGTPAGLLGYQSGWADPASGRDLMGARWYAPSAGDFTSADTITVSPDPDPAAGNPFAYAADDPLDATDPTGHLCVLGVCTSSVAHAASSLYHGAVNTYHAIVKKVTSSPIVKAAVKKAAPLINRVKAIARPVANLAVKVWDGAKAVVHTGVYLVTHAVAAAKALFKAVKAMPIVQKAMTALKTAGKALKTAGTAVKNAAVSAGRSLRRFLVPPRDVTTKPEPTKRQEPDEEEPAPEDPPESSSPSPEERDSNPFKPGFDQQAQGCFVNGAPSGPVYGNLDTQGGVLTPGRAVLATACLPQPKGVKVQRMPFPGYDNTQMDKTHLLSAELGGSGGRRNIVPFGWQANQVDMEEAVDKIKADLASGRVFYQAYPVYGSLDSANNYQNIRNYEPLRIVITWEAQSGPDAGDLQYRIIRDSVGSQPPRSK